MTCVKSVPRGRGDAYSRIPAANLPNRVIALSNNVYVPFLHDGRYREPISVLRQLFPGVILCAARMLTFYNGQRRASAMGGAVAAPLVYCPEYI